MRTHPISTRTTLVLAAIVLLAPMLAISLNVGARLTAPVHAMHDRGN